MNGKRPSRPLLVQSQQFKHQNNVLLLLKVNSKDTRTTLEQISQIVPVFPFLTVNKQMPAGVIPFLTLQV